MAGFALETLVGATALLVVAFAVTAVMRNASAAARHHVWSATIVGILALPVLEIAVPWRLGVVPVLSTVPERVVSPGSSVEMNAGEVGSPGATEPVLEAGATNEPIARGTEAGMFDSAGPAAPTGTSGAGLGIGSRNSDLARFVWFAWILGVAFVAGRLLVGSASVWFLARRARPVTSRSWYTLLGRVTERLSLRVPVRLARSPRIAMPITTGVVRPAIVLPADSEWWSEDRRQAVLLHELAHVRRHDLVLHWLAWVACAVYWFHPLAWKAARQLRHESERACDDLVIESGTRPSSYAEHLLEIVRAAGFGRSPTLAMPMAQRSRFEGRLLAILEADVRRTAGSRFGMLGAVVGVVAIAVPLAAMGPAAGQEMAPGEEAIESTAEAPPPTGIEKFTIEVPRIAARPVVVAPGTELQAEVERQAEASRDVDREGAEREVEALVPALADREAAVRAEAARSLGELEDPRSVEALSRALRTDESAEVRRMAAWALGEIEDPAAVPALDHAIRNDADVEVRRMAAWALGEIESPAAVDALGAAIGDGDLEVRMAAAWALGEIEDPRAVPWLKRAMGDSNPGVRRKAAWALGEIESLEAVDPLARALGDDDAEVRQTAAWALGEIQPEAAPPALVEAAGDVDPEVRKMAAWALGEIEDPAAIPALRRLLSDEVGEVQKTALWALMEMDDDLGRDTLIELLEDADPEVRREAARALGERN